jgi:hypothetical protein
MYLLKFPNLNHERYAYAVGAWKLFRLPNSTSNILLQTTLLKTQFVNVRQKFKSQSQYNAYIIYKNTLSSSSSSMLL